MESRFERAKVAQQAIQESIENYKQTNRSVQAVFLPSELRYAIAALPDSALRFDMERGETIYGVPVIRYISDDMSMFFVAQSCFADGTGGHPKVRHSPFYGMPRKESKL